MEINGYITRDNTTTQNNFNNKIKYEMVFENRKVTLRKIVDEMQDVKVEYDCDLSTALRQIQVLLKGEIEYWFKSDNSTTSDKIMKYDQALELLVIFIQEKDIKSFLLVFQKFDITIKGIRECFRASGGGVKVRRNAAHQLFANACRKMVGILQKESIKVLGQQIIINEVAAEAFFEGEYKKAMQGIEEDDLSMFS